MTIDVSPYVGMLLTAVVIPLMIQGIRWAQKKINEIEFFKNRSIDEAVFKALELGVENVGNDAADMMKRALADGKITEEEWREMRVTFRDKALDTAETILDKDVRVRLNNMSDEAIDAIIAYCVDKRTQALEIPKVAKCG